MERQFCINWSALVEEAKLRRKAQKLTQAKLAKLAGISTPTVSRFESGEADIQLPTVLSIFGVLGMVDARRLHFPEPKEYYDPTQRVVVFFGKDAVKTIKCAISSETLEDHFKLERQDELKVFKANRERIEHEVRRKYLSERVETDGSILVKSEDI